MEIFYNELSNQPLASNDEDAKKRIITLLETMKSLRELGFNIMRTHEGFYADQVSSGYSFSIFFEDTTIKMELKILLRSIVVSPFIEDVDSYEAEVFIDNSFSTKNHLGVTLSPEGLASAYVYSSPTISIGDNSFWQKETISLTISSNGESSQTKIADVLNVYSPASIFLNKFQSWIDSLTPEILLNSEVNIYKIFPQTRFEFDPRAINDVISWFYDDKRFLIRVKELIEDIETNPFNGGKGKTELLSRTSRKASKRIIKKDRIVYTYTKEKITIHQCRGHYDDN